MSDDTLEDLFKAGGAFALAIAFLFSGPESRIQTRLQSRLAWLRSIL
jgi:hypothetical protein